MSTIDPVISSVLINNHISKTKNKLELLEMKF